MNKNSIIDLHFEWADKYFAASVSNDKIDVVRRYIRNQQEHHKKKSFTEEYEQFLAGIGYGRNDFKDDFG